MVSPKVDGQLVLQGRALGDPTRHHIFRYIADAGRPVGVAELTADVKLNHNAVRQHLAVLRQAALVVEEIEERDRPGRPRLLYRIAPEAEGSWGTPGPMDFLAQALAEAISTNASPYEVGRRLGRERAGELGPELEVAEPAELLEEEMARRGFRPSAKDRAARLELSLHHCPFVSVAERSPEIVCELHRGLTDGLCEGLGELEVTEFTPRRNKRQVCRVAARVGPG
jgi:predicted ArsR family transcriptional regulator